jgi:uncharacterized protein YecT (DUF1311 family)
MKQLLTGLLLLFCSAIFSQTQLELNENANAAFKKADDELNTVYKQILSKFKFDTVFIKNLKISKRLFWILYKYLIM